MSETADEVIANAGSRYGPTAPLAGVRTALARGEAFAIIAKPCDLGALHRYAQLDPRLDELCVARLALVCGGQSRLSKSTALLDEIGVDEPELTLFRYRGHGNPGRTRIETRQGSVHEKTYLELWEDESAWQLETRCKVCPDALGEAADISAADAWPGGAPAGEDEGFNTIVVRSDSGGRLLAAAVDAGQVVLGEAIGPRTFDELQPHQVRKKMALAARYEGMADAGVAPIETHGLRVAELGERLRAQARAAERAGTARRILEARRA
jgi:coenzyme F420 hydrogenase subunit beta